jgi:hypothetical protein
LQNLKWSRDHFKKREISKSHKIRINKLIFQTMKNLMQKALTLIISAKVHATHTAIKGKKSGGNRDSNGVDWCKHPNGSGPININ